MTVLVTADLHLNSNPRDGYRHTFLVSTLPGLLRQHKAKCLVIAGDLTDDKDRHPAPLVNRIVQGLRGCTAICPVVLLRGNHDYIDSEHPFFAFTSNLPALTWINNPTSALILQLKVLPPSWMFLPHTTNWKRDWEPISFKDYTTIFAHQTFAGAAVGPRKMEGIPPSIFPAGVPIVSGDIHQPQTFGSVWYVGAPYTVDFGDEYEPRVLLLAGRTPQSIPVPGVQKRLVHVQSVTELAAQERMLNRGDILKVRVALKMSDHARWPAIQEQVRAWGAKRGYQIHLVQPVIGQQPGKATARRRAETHTDEQLMERYGSARAVNSRTLSTGLQLMRKV